MKNETSNPVEAAKQKELRKKELLYMFPLFLAFFIIAELGQNVIVTYLAGVILIALYGMKRQELRQEGLKGGPITNIIFDYWKITLGVFTLVCAVIFISSLIESL